MKASNTQILRSPIRWVGSKYHLQKVLFELFPKSFNRYYEPMFGGGAVFFLNNISNAYLSDKNDELINYYKVLRDYHKEFIDYLLTLNASKETYYKFRESKPVEAFERAIRFAYLNRLSWNGVYRVNKNGDFNVPFGGRTPVKLWSKEHLQKCSSRLTDSDIVCSDYRASVAQCKKDDLVFLDPPYPKGVNSGLGFNRYTSSPFTLESHGELADLFIKLTENRVKVILTLGQNEDIINLYPKSTVFTKLHTKSLISCNGNSRRESIEYIIRNYK